MRPVLVNWSYSVPSTGGAELNLLEAHFAAAVASVPMAQAGRYVAYKPAQRVQITPPTLPDFIGRSAAPMNFQLPAQTYVSLGYNGLRPQQGSFDVNGGWPIAVAGRRPLGFLPNFFGLFRRRLA